MLYNGVYGLNILRCNMNMLYRMKECNYISPGKGRGPEFKSWLRLLLNCNITDDLFYGFMKAKIVVSIIEGIIIQKILKLRKIIFPSFKLRTLLLLLNRFQINLIPYYGVIGYEYLSPIRFYDSRK